MNKTFRTRFLALGLAGLSALATGAAHAQAAGKSAEPAFYGEIGYSALEYRDGDGSGGFKVHPKQVRLIAGAELHPNLAIEGLLGLHASNGSTDVFGSDLKVKIDHAWGLFLKPKVAVTPEFELFARLGYARNKVTFTENTPIGRISVSDSASDFAYGVGASYAINEKVSVNLDYMSYYDKDGVRIKGATLGLGMKF